jgi:hypothetical protein
MQELARVQLKEVAEQRWIAARWKVSDMDMYDDDGRIDTHRDHGQLLPGLDEKGGPVLVDGAIAPIETPQVCFDVFLGPHAIH